LTWRASLDHDLSDEVMGYLAASRGFQAGAGTCRRPEPAFGPETLDDFEAGLKYADRSGRVSADASVFYYDYSDLQVSGAHCDRPGDDECHVRRDSTGSSCSSTRGSADRPTSTLGAQLSRRASGASPTRPAPITTPPRRALLRDHLRRDREPASVRARAQVQRRVRPTRSRWAAAALLRLSANLAYNSGYFAEPDNVVRQGSFATVDASAEWRPVRRGPSVRLWVLNLTDAYHYNALATVATVASCTTGRTAAVRRFRSAYAF
jgi:outer membrane receptor protein involved in Fe transport